MTVIRSIAFVQLRKIPGTELRNWGGWLFLIKTFKLHPANATLQSVWSKFLFPLSGCRNKLISFQLSCPSSPLQSAHSELCHWAWWQQGLISYEHSSDSGRMIGPSGLSDPFSGSVQVEQPQENLSLLLNWVSNSLIFLLTRGSCANKVCVCVSLE